MVELILETDDLIFQLDNFSLALDQLGLLALEVEGLGVDELVEVVDAGQLLGDVVLQGSGLGSQVIGLLGLHLVLVVQFVDLFGILSVSLSQVHQLGLQVLLLRLQLRVQILVLGQVTSQSGDFSVSRVQDVLLGVELSVEVSILLLSVDEKTLLVIDLLSEGGNHVDIDLDPALVVVLHSPLLVGNPVEVLLQSQQLVLQQLVLSFSLPQLHGFGSQLGHESVLVVLGDGGVREFSLWAS